MWEDLLLEIETTADTDRPMTRYLVDCIERMLLARAGCLDILSTAREVRDAAEHAHTSHTSGLSRSVVSRARSRAWREVRHARMHRYAVRMSTPMRTTFVRLVSKGNFTSKPPADSTLSATVPTSS